MDSFSDYLAHGNAWLFIPAAILLGALHGLEPGHSKTMMAAFIVAIRGTVKQAVLLGVSATISHTAIIWVLAFIGLKYAGRFDVETTEPYFQVATGVIVMGMAAWMFARTRRSLHAAAAHSHSHDHNHRHGHSHSHSHGHSHNHDHSQGHKHDDDHDHNHRHGAHGGTLVKTGVNEQIEVSVFETDVPPRFRLYFYDQKDQRLTPPAADTLHLETVRPDGGRQRFDFVLQEDYLEATAHLPEPHEFQLAIKFSSGVTLHTRFVEDHQHQHPPATVPGEYQDEHEREHAEELQKRFANQTVTTKQLVIFGLTGGLLPCPSAFAVLLICLQLKRFALGFALVLAFSLGLALTLVSVGALAALSVRHASKRFQGFGELARKAPYVSSIVMALIGLYIAAAGLKHLLH